MYLYRLDYGHEDGSSTLLYASPDRLPREAFLAAADAALQSTLAALISQDPAPSLASLACLTMERLLGSKEFERAMSARGFNPAPVEAHLSLYSMDRPLGAEDTKDLGPECQNLRGWIELDHPGLRDRVQAAEKSKYEKFQAEGMAAFSRLSKKSS